MLLLVVWLPSHFLIQGWFSPGQVFVLDEYCARNGVRGCHRHLGYLGDLLGRSDNGAMIDPTLLHYSFAFCASHVHGNRYRAAKVKSAEVYLGASLWWDGLVTIVAWAQPKNVQLLQGFKAIVLLWFLSCKSCSINYVILNQSLLKAVKAQSSVTALSSFTECMADNRLEHCVQPRHTGNP